MKAVHFGAGNLGRGFIIPLLLESGYEVTIVDTNLELVRALVWKKYRLLIATENGIKEEKEITGFIVQHASQKEKVMKAIAEADLITTAVGESALQDVAKQIRDGLSWRHAELKSKEKKPLIVIACENIARNSTYLQALIRTHFKYYEHWQIAADGVSFPDCVVDRIVPTPEPILEEAYGKLAILTEESSRLVIEKNSVTETSLILKGIELNKEIKPLFEQKFFTLNTAHALFAYFGALQGITTFKEALKDATTILLVFAAVVEINDMLIARHRFSKKDQEAFTRQTMKRIANPFLCDEIPRIAKNPIRKLAPYERLVAPARYAEEDGARPEFLAAGIAAALHYKNLHDRESLLLSSLLDSAGLEYVLNHICAIRTHEPLATLIKDAFFSQCVLKP